MSGFRMILRVLCPCSCSLTDCLKRAGEYKQLAARNDELRATVDLLKEEKANLLIAPYTLPHFEEINDSADDPVSTPLLHGTLNASLFFRAVSSCVFSSPSLSVSLSDSFPAASCLFSSCRPVGVALISFVVFFSRFVACLLVAGVRLSLVVSRQAELSTHRTEARRAVELFLAPWTL